MTQDSNSFYRPSMTTVGRCGRWLLASGGFKISQMVSAGYALTGRGGVARVGGYRVAAVEALGMFFIDVNLFG